MLSALPPVIVGGALIIPKGLLYKLSDKTDEPLFRDGDRKKIELAAMEAVMEAEREQGYEPHDVSAEKRGYDIESLIPEDKRDGTASLRFIEVKGRAKGATTVTVTSNEIRWGLNVPEQFILALVEVDGYAPARTVYLKRPFRNAPDFTATSVNFDIAELIRQSEVVYER